jgi:hypothetical protein
LRVLNAATALCWADDGQRTVPAAAGLVYLPVRRIGLRPVDPATLHVGYGAAVIETDDEPPAVTTLIDGHLVQARRHGAAGAYQFLDDAAALGVRPDTGITSVAEAWADRGHRERGTALLVKTAPGDVDVPAAALPGICRDHGLVVREGAGGLLPQPEIQAL